MRYLLILTGICALLIGVTVASRDSQSTWILSGVICISVGLAAIETIRAVEKADGDGYRKNMDRFQHAIETDNVESAVEILTKRGVDQTTAESAVMATANSHSDF